MSPAARTNPRKTPRQARASASVEAVLEAAARILEAGGSFNTNAVAARAGLSVGSLYQYFPGKDAVLAALIRREAALFEAALDHALATAATLPLADAIAVLAEVAVAHQTARPRLARILDFEEQRLGLGGEAGDAAAGVASRLAAFLSSRRAEIGDLDPHEAAADLLYLARGLTDGALEGGRTGGLTQRITRAALGYLRGPVLEAAQPQPPPEA